METELAKNKVLHILLVFYCILFPFIAIYVAAYHIKELDNFNTS